MTIEYTGDGPMPPRGLSEADVKMIARQAGRAAAEEALPKMMLQLGVDISDPDAVIELQADRQWTRRTRKSAEETGKHARKVGVGAALIFALTIFGLGVRAWLKQNGVSE